MVTMANITDRQAVSVTNLPQSQATLLSYQHCNLFCSMRILSHSNVDHANGKRQTILHIRYNRRLYTYNVHCTMYVHYRKSWQSFRMPRKHQQLKHQQPTTNNNEKFDHKTNRIAAAMAIAVQRERSLHGQYLVNCFA